MAHILQHMMKQHKYDYIKKTLVKMTRFPAKREGKEPLLLIFLPKEKLIVDFSIHFLIMGEPVLLHYASNLGKEN